MRMIFYGYFSELLRCVAQLHGGNSQLVQVVGHLELLDGIVHKVVGLLAQQGALGGVVPAEAGEEHHMVAVLGADQAVVAGLAAVVKAPGVKFVGHVALRNVGPLHTRPLRGHPL